eukprot:1860226-Prymnesium_polylepis.1
MSRCSRRRVCVFYLSCPSGCLASRSSGRPLPTGTTIRVDRACRHTQRCRVSAAAPPHPLTDHSTKVLARPIPCVYNDSGRVLWTGRVRGCFVHVPTGRAQDRLPLAVP